MGPVVALFASPQVAIRAANFWAGVGTPWTLASDLVWTRPHRVADSLPG